MRQRLRLLQCRFRILGLVLREDNRKDSSSSSITTVALELPDELPSVEDRSKTPAATVKDENVDLENEKKRDYGILYR